MVAYRRGRVKLLTAKNCHTTSSRRRQGGDIKKRIEYVVAYRRERVQLSRLSIGGLIRLVIGLWFYCQSIVYQSSVVSQSLIAYLSRGGGAGHGRGGSGHR